VILPGFLRRSIRRKLAALVAATTLAALVVMAAALIVYTVGDYRATRVADLQTQAEIVGRASAPALDFDDPHEARLGLAMLEARDDVERAALYSSGGRLFASWARDGGDPGFASDLQTLGVRFEGGRLTLVQPVMDDGRLQGTVVLVASYGLRQRLLAYGLILLAVMSAALIAALALSSWLQRAVTAPILGVADTARGVVERRDLSVRAPRVTEDEIGTLAEAMNRMLADLEREMAERRGAEEGLRAADRRKDEFLATLAHELRNPLAPIRNALYLMQLRPDDAPVVASAAAIIERQVQQMVRLIDDLLEVSRITTGTLVLRCQPVELRSIALAAIEASEPIARARDQTLTTRLPAPGLTIEADPTRLAQVFSNLLNNAVKFTDPGGRVEFSLDVRDGEVVGSVRDNGRGIPPEMLDSIFEMFVQGDRSLERATGGLGVGLSLSRKLVEQHGGTLEAKSAGVGQGAEFVVRIPAAPLAPATGAGSAPGLVRGLERDAVKAAGTRVLVVDDNRDFAVTLKSILQSMGHEVQVEHDGLAGLATARTFRPVIAFVDIGMPRMNGYELAKRVRALPEIATCILVAVSGLGQATDRQLAREAGFDEHLVKPVEPERLQQLLARLTDRSATAD
jgi:signal transduction histidine kinase/ActR/RegA family two-component response regulator